MADDGTCILGPLPGDLGIGTVIQQIKAWKENRGCLMGSPSFERSTGVQSMTRKAP